MSISRNLFISGLVSLSAATASATILAYDGFATDASGTGDFYQDGQTLGSFLPGAGSQILPTNTATGVNKTRLGFTGGWGQVKGQMSANVNSRGVLGGLSYTGYKVGDAGSGYAYRASGSPGADKWIGRQLTVTNDGGQLDDGYFVSALVDFNDRGGGGFGFGTLDRYNFIEANGATAKFTSGGSAGDIATNLAVNASGVNLIVIQYTNITDPLNYDPDFYSQWNLWINPDITDGDLGTPTVTGYGVGLLDGGSITPPTVAFLSSSNLGSGEQIYVDEFYVTTSASDFMAIPEPSTYALIAGLATLGLLIRRRKA